MGQSLQEMTRLCLTITLVLMKLKILTPMIFALDNHMKIRYSSILNQFTVDHWSVSMIMDHLSYPESHHEILNQSKMATQGYPSLPWHILKRF